MFSDVGTACDEILGSPGPVIFFDSCSFLNIINSLHDRNIPDSYWQNVVELHELSERNAVWLISCESVYEEWCENVANVETTAKRQIESLDKSLQALLRIANQVAGANLGKIMLSHFELQQNAKAFSQTILEGSILLRRQDTHSINAMNRVRKNLAPAKQGGREAKDCEIIECFLELSTELRGRSFPHEIVFFTFNKLDFGKSKAPRPPLDEEFAAVEAELITHPNYLLALIKGGAET